jgi:hypothetical protein
MQQHDERPTALFSDVHANAIGVDQAMRDLRHDGLPGWVQERENVRKAAAPDYVIP